MSAGTGPPNAEKDAALGKFGYAEARVLEAMAILRDLNREGEPSRSRELSIGITYLEDGLLRVNQAHRRYAGMEP